MRMEVQLGAVEVLVVGGGGLWGWGWRFSWVGLRLWWMEVWVLVLPHLALQGGGMGLKVLLGVGFGGRGSGSCWVGSLQVGFSRMWLLRGSPPSWVFNRALQEHPWNFPHINHRFELIKWEDSLLSMAPNVQSIFQTVKVTERVLNTPPCQNYSLHINERERYCKFKL